MVYNPGPYGVPPVQSDPLRQALNPMSSATQGYGGTMSGLPFAPPPPPPPLPQFVPPVPHPTYSPFGWTNPAQRLDFSAANTGVLGLRSISSSFLPTTPAPVLNNPGVYILAQQEAMRRVGGLAVGAPVGAVQSLTSYAGTALVMGGLWKSLRATPAALGHLTGGFERAMAAGSIPGAVGALGRGAFRAAGSMLMPSLPYAAAAATMFGIGRGVVELGMGAAHLRDVSRGTERYFGGMAGIGAGGVLGRGMAFSDQALMGETLREINVSAPFRRFETSYKNFERLAASGVLAGGSRNIKDMRTKLTKAMETMSELVDTLSVTFDEAGEIFLKMRSSGFSSRADMIRYALNSRITGAITGLGTQRMLEIGSAGAGMARSMGLYGSAGSLALQGTTGAIAAAFRSGGLSEEILREVAGGNINYEKAATALAGNAMNYLSNQGQFLVAAAMNPRGEIDKNLVRQITSGKISLTQAMAMGERNIRSYGGMSRFIGARRRLTSQFLQAGGTTAIPSLMYQTVRQVALQTTGSDDPDTMRAVAMQQFGMSEQEAELMLQVGNPVTLQSVRSLEEESARATAREEVMTRYGTFGAKWERQVATPFRRLLKVLQEPFAGLYKTASTTTEKFFRGVSGDLFIPTEFMTPGIRRMYMGRTGGELPFSSGNQDLLQAGLENIYSGVSGMGLRLKTATGIFGDYSKVSPEMLRGAAALAARGGSGILEGREFIARDILMTHPSADLLGQAEKLQGLFEGEKGKKELEKLVEVNEENLKVAKRLLAETSAVKDHTKITATEVKAAIQLNDEYRERLTKTLVMSDLSSKGLGPGVPQFDIRRLLESIESFGAGVMSPEEIRSRIRSMLPSPKSLSTSKDLTKISRKEFEALSSYGSLLKDEKFLDALINRESPLAKFLLSGKGIDELTALLESGDETAIAFGTAIQKLNQNYGAKTASEVFQKAKSIAESGQIFGEKGNYVRYVQSRRRRFAGLMESDSTFRDLLAQQPEEYRKYILGEEVSLDTAGKAYAFAQLTANLEREHALRLIKGGISSEERATMEGYGVTEGTYSAFRRRLMGLREGLLSGDTTAQKMARERIKALASASTAYFPGETEESIQAKIEESLRKGVGDNEFFLNLHLAQQQGGTIFAEQDQAASKMEKASASLSETVLQLDQVLNNFVERLNNTDVQPIGNARSE